MAAQERRKKYRTGQRSRWEKAAWMKENERKINRQIDK